MWHKLKSTLPSALSPLALGLFAGRVLSEQWAISYGPSWLVAIVLTAALCLLATFSLRPHPLRQTWPLLLLLGYVGYPQPYPMAAIVVVVLVTAVLYQIIPLPTHILQKHDSLRLSLAGSTLLFALLYIFSVAPGLLPADNGEFQLVGATLGVAHPPGFPLYTMLSKAMTLLPIATSAAHKINLLSALTSTATLGIVYLTVFRLTNRQFAAVTAVLSLGTATTFWAQATTANIRSLTALFAALAIFALVCHWQEKAHTDRYLVLFAAAISFGFTHHLSLAFMGLVFFLSLILLDPNFIKTPTRWKRPLFAALLGLLPLLYLPLRAEANAPGVLSSLNTWSGFFNHFLALGFQGDFFYFVEPVVLWQRLQVMGNVLTFQFSPWLLGGAFVGLLWLLRHQWRMALLLGGSFALHTLVTATYRAPQTVEYMLPAYVPIAICIGIASGYLHDFGRKRESRRWLMWTMTAVLFTAAAVQGWQHWPSFAMLHNIDDTRDYTQDILDSAPPGSLILANWHWATPLWYLQTVEGSRPDVTIQYVAPGGEPYSQTWVRQIGEGLANGRSVVATYIDEAAYAALPAAEPLGEALLFPQSPRLELPPEFTALNNPLNNELTIVGYRLDQPVVVVGQETTVTVAWQANTESALLFMHLLDETESIVAQNDVQARTQSDGLTLTQFRLTPRQGAAQFTLRLGSGSNTIDLATLFVEAADLPPATQHPVYRPVLDSDTSLILVGYDWDNSLPGQTRLYYHWLSREGYFSTTSDSAGTQTLSHLLAPWGVPQPHWRIPPSLPDDHYVPLGEGIVWTGASLTDLETAVSPGKSYSLPMQFINGRPLLHDYVVSTRLVGYDTDNFTWAWCDLIDGIPAMGSIPTLKWIQGSVVQSPRTIVFPPRTNPANFNGFCQSEKPAPDTPYLFVDNVATPGQAVGGILQLYDAFTNRPLPILDERITAVYSWIPLGETTIGD